MAKEQSFDIVSRVDMQEVDNAYQQAKREISQRYDLKDSGSSIALDKTNATLKIIAPSDFVGRQVIDVVSSKLVKRKIDLKAITWEPPAAAAGGMVAFDARIINGIDKETAGKINRDIKALKYKVKVQIGENKLRVSSTSRDTLQKVIAYIKDKDYGQPLQYVNYR